MRTDDRSAVSSRTLHVACVVTAGLALLQLPVDRVPLPWSLAFLGAGMLFRIARAARLRARPIAGLALAFAGSTAAFTLAHALSGAMGRPGTIASILLLALGFHTAARRGPDVPLTIFLGFCLLLVGRILANFSGELVATGIAGSPGAALALMGALVWTLQLDARRTTIGDTVAGVVRKARPALPWTRPSLRARLAITTLLIAGVFAAGMDRLEAAVTGAARSTTTGGRSTEGNPTRSDANDSEPAAGTRRRNAIGLGNDFELDHGDNGDAWTLALRVDRLCELEALDRRPLPRDILLRFDAFDIAELRRWRRSDRQAEAPSALLSPLRPHLLGAVGAGRDARRARVEMLEKLADAVLVPTGCWRVEAPVRLAYSDETDLLRVAGPRLPPARWSYVVDWSSRASGADDQLRSATTAGSSTYLRLEPSLRPHVAFLRRTLEELVRDDNPADLARRDLNEFMARLSAGLQDRCTYRLAPPRGPNRVEVLDFLDERGDRSGFCMHFASAGAILLRLAGVPCRIAVGLAGGEVLEDGDPSRRQFGSRHAHAWIEVRTASGRWRAFDASPPSATAIGAARGWPGQDDDDSDTTEASTMFAGPVLQAMFGRHGKLAAVVLALLLVISSVSLLQRLVAIRKPLARTRPGEPSLPGETRRDFAAMFRALRDLGFGARDLRTPELAIRRLSVTAEIDHRLLLAGYRAYQEVRFGGRGYDAERRDAVRAATAAMATTA